MRTKNSSKIVKGFLAVYNLGQEVIDKFTKLSNIGFPMECFIADFLQFFTVKRQNLLGGRVGICYQIQAFQGFS